MKAILRHPVGLVGVLLLAVSGVVLLPSVARAGGPGRWTNLCCDIQSAQAYGQASLVRTPDRLLHIIYAWENEPDAAEDYYSVLSVGPEGAVLGGGVIPGFWGPLRGNPVLLPDGSGLRALFSGGGDAPYSANGAMYTATSPDGKTWSLFDGSMSHMRVADARSFGGVELGDGTPIASWVFHGSMYWHVGTDPGVPAGAGDDSFTLAQPGRWVTEGALALDPTTGEVWAVYHAATTGSSGGGIYARRIADPSGATDLGPELHAPASSTAAGASMSRLSVATRTSGGIYAAYCAGAPRCASIRLWRVGAPTSTVVPRSVGATEVDVSPGPAGRLWIAWLGSGRHTVFATRTGPGAHAFGAVRAMRGPGHHPSMDGLVVEGSRARLDVVLYDEFFFHTQILPGLSLRASPSRFGDLTSHTVTFTVLDAGVPVEDALIRVAGHIARTNVAGVAAILFRSGFPTGSYIATASKGGYASAARRIHVT